jgi:hypothetical protein
MSDQLFERAVRDWLDDGSDKTPPAAIEAVLLAAKTTPQERVLGIPRRFNPMPTYLRFAAIVAVIAIVGVGAVSYFGDGSRSGGTLTPTPSPRAVPTGSPGPSVLPSSTSTTIATSDWTSFTSARYGFTMSHPPLWAALPADHDWTFENDIESWSSTGTDSFFTNAAGGVKVSAWAVRVTPGTTAVSWIQSWCDGTNPDPCPDVRDTSTEVAAGDGHAGVLVRQTDSMAAFLEGDSVYVVAIWREEDDPSVTPYGGAARLLEAFLSTMVIPAEPPQGLPTPN